MTFDFYGLVRFAALLTFVWISASLLLLLFQQWKSPTLRDLAFNRFPAIIGIPAAAVFSFLIVASFESTSGIVRFEALAFRFEGAAGPIVMWIFCLLSLAGCIRLLWPLRAD